MKTEAPITESILSAWGEIIDINDKFKLVEDDLFKSHRALELELEAAKVKLGERKTIHQWLNRLDIPRCEDTGKPMCLLRRLAVALNVSPQSPPYSPALRPGQSRCTSDHGHCDVRNDGDACFAHPGITWCEACGAVYGTTKWESGCTSAMASPEILAE